MIEQVDAGWSVREFHGVDLGDARLNRRLLALAETFGAQPTAPINQASADWYSKSTMVVKICQKVYTSHE